MTVAFAIALFALVAFLLAAFGDRFTTRKIELIAIGLALNVVSYLLGLG